MNRIKSNVVRLLAFVFGMPIFLLGLVITPIPPPFPPGWPVALLGLWILSFGFEWAEKRRKQIVTWFKKLWNDAMAPVKEEWRKQKEEEKNKKKK